MKFRFKPEDFGNYIGFSREGAAIEANQILEAHLAKCPKVYVKMEAWDRQGSCTINKQNQFNHYTHRAILFDVEEIEKPKPCEHDQVSFTPADNHRPYDFRCKDCDQIVKPTGWQTVEG